VNEASILGRRVNPGIGQLGLRTASLIYLSAMVLIPLVVIVGDGFQEGWGEFWRQINLPLAFHAIKLSLWTSAVMTIINATMGLATAYVLVRYEFPGKRLINALVDLPLAIPTLVTGVMLVILFGPQQIIGAFLQQQIGIQVIFAPPGIVLALLFVTLPFVVRNVQPVLMNVDREQEHAAATLGASQWTIFWRITFPSISLPLLSGSLLGFARAIGEFGSVVIVAGNIPLVSQVAAVYVLGEVESENRLGASAVSIVLISVAFGVMWISDWIYKRLER
jgi:sulfate/thiosulfate transport system permease protein